MTTSIFNLLLTKFHTNDDLETNNSSLSMELYLAKNII